LIERADLVGL